jgi:glycosyltransferase involved in cell wall biosynthesis
LSVSIVTPNFNNAPYVDRYLAAVMADDSVSEIVIYDNASTDGSPDLFERLGSPKVRVYRGDENVGATLGRHEAVLAASNEFVIFLDGDDWFGHDAVSQSLAALRRDDLDLALLRFMFVDEDGSNPRVFLEPPAAPIDGRSAAAMTMGGWRIHSCGVMRKELYLRAWDGFDPTGFLADEVLTRRILLQCRRVGGCQGEAFYRQVPKTYSPEQMIGWGRSTVRALALGVEADLDAAPMQQQRRATVRFMFGLARRAMRGTAPREDVGALLDEYFRIPTRWTPADAPWAAVDGLLRVLRRRL